MLKRLHVLASLRKDASRAERGVEDDRELSVELDAVLHHTTAPDCLLRLLDS